MTLDPLHIVLLLVAAGAVGAALWAWRAQAAAQAEAAAQRGLAEHRGRSLGLTARDIHAAGLSLLGRAQVLGGEAGRAFEAEARHFLALADATAEAGHAATGPRALREERFPLAPVLQEAVAVAAQQLGPGLRHWRVDSAIEGLVVRADRRALRGALIQVLSRAARATREGDFIDIRPDRNPSTVTIVVEDEGVGLAVEDLSPTAHDGRADRSRGLGLGLSLARALLRAHGGELVVEAAPGIGARAVLSLPAERVVAA